MIKHTEITPHKTRKSAQVLKGSSFRTLNVPWLSHPDLPRDTAKGDLQFVPRVAALFPCTLRTYPCGHMQEEMAPKPVNTAATLTLAG